MRCLLSEIVVMPTTTPWQVIEEVLARKRPVRGPKWLADQLGEKIQTVMNWKARGVPARRYRDVAGVLGITVDQLEGVSPLPGAPASDAQIPFTQELRERLLTLNGDALYTVEKLVRAHLDMPHISASDFANSRHIGTDEQESRAYSRGHEETAGLPDDMQVPETQRHGRSETNRGRAGQKGRGGA